eukprot:4527432-Lingulodinium_polyedra.AAC.1
MTITHTLRCRGASLALGILQAAARGSDADAPETGGIPALYAATVQTAMRTGQKVGIQAEALLLGN